MSRLDPARLDPATLLAYLEGTPRQQRELAEHVLDLVERAVARELRKRHPVSHAHREDLVSEVLENLYRNDGRVLRQWDPERGCASLKTFLDMVGRRHAWRRLAAEPNAVSFDEADAPLDAVVRKDPEDELALNAALERLANHMLEHGSRKDISRFRALFVDGQSPTVVANLEGTTPEAIYTWASRLKQRLAAAFPQIVALLESRSRASRPKQ